MSEATGDSTLRRRARRRGLQLIKYGDVYELRDDDGVSVHVGTFDSANACIRQRYGPMRKGPRPGPLLSTPAAWAPAIGAYLTTLVAAGQSAATIELRRQQLGQMARELNGVPADVTGEQLVAWLGGHPDWSIEHRRGNRSAARLFFLWAYKTRRIPVHIADDLPKIRQPRGAARPAPDHVWRQALLAADPRTTLILRLAAEAGLRRAEISQVHSRDLTESVDGARLLVHGKGNKPRVIPISDSLAETIRQVAERDGWLFPNGMGGHLRPYRVAQLAGFVLPDGWTLHTLRHRFCTRAYRGSRNLRAVQVLMGHASIATTERYIAVDDDEVRAAMLSAL